MRRLLTTLIKPVTAQTKADAVAQPTFFTDIDFSNSGDNGGNGGNNGNNTQASGSISILTDSSSFPVGGEFSLNIKVAAGDTEVASYTVKLEYNSQIFSVVDADAEVSGTQVEFLDTTFNEVTNEVNTTTGTILIKGEIGTPVTIDKVVAKVKFKSQQPGAAEIKVVKAESSIVDDTSANILETANGLSINVGQTIGQPSQIIDDPLTPVSSPISDVKKLPDSNLPFAGILYMALGIALIAIGIQAKRLTGQRQLD